MTQILLDAKALADLTIEGLLEKKGKKIVRLDLRKSDGAVTDFFVICTGTSDTHVEALADSVTRMVREQSQEKPAHTEGMGAAEWVLLDYINVVVHIFQEEKRNFYRLEHLWGDADTTRIEESF